MRCTIKLKHPHIISTVRDVLPAHLKQLTKVKNGSALSKEQVDQVWVTATNCEIQELEVHSMKAKTKVITFGTPPSALETSLQLPGGRPGTVHFLYGKIVNFMAPAHHLSY